MRINGILNINKPEGITSFSTVSRLKRLSGEKHVGHAGTLDPMATGVLPVCFGKATRIASFVSDSSKTYLADIELGISTDTYDREGRITSRSPVAGIGREQVARSLKNFTGTIEQVPPAYSAIKKNGKKLYQLARSGVDFKPPPRKVTINRIELLAFDLPVISIELDCSKGTYVRSLAFDLGQELGCGAHLSKLVRSRCGIFDIAGSVALSEAERAFRQGSWESLLYPLDHPLTMYPKFLLDSAQQKDVSRGISIQLDYRSGADGELVRAYDSRDKMLALLKYDSSTGLWHPYRVFMSPDAS